MDLLQAAGDDWQGMTNVWLRRQPSLREFVSGIDEPKRWRDRPVSGLPGAYAGAASVLMEKMISLEPEAPDRASALLPPYLFLRRHHFEMQLKSILRTVADNTARWTAVTGKNVASNLYSKVSRTHSLQDMWTQVQPLAETVWANETHRRQPPDVTPTDISELIEQFDDIDPRGDGVRYVRDNKGDLTMLGVSRVDLEHTERNMLDITEFFWWVRIEVGYIMIDHSKYLTSVDLQDLKEADVILQAYLDEELVAVR